MFPVTMHAIMPWLCRNTEHGLDNYVKRDVFHNLSPLDHTHNNVDCADYQLLYHTVVFLILPSHS